MRLGPPGHLKVNVEPDDRVLFEAPGSEIRGKSVLALVGGRVFVTSRHVAFTPNYLAAVLGRRPIVRPISEITESVEMVDLGFPLGDVETIRLRPTDPLEPSLAFMLHGRADEMRAAIQKSRYWG